MSKLHTKLRLTNHWMEKVTTKSIQSPILSLSTNKIHAIIAAFPS